MIACVDSSYSASGCRTALVLFVDWRDEMPAAEFVQSGAIPAEYISGQFFRRELPGALAILQPHLKQLQTIVIDGYVWLDSANRPGLGAALFEALGETVPVIGVAKTFFAGSQPVQLLRGKSARPLFITAAGLALELAAQHIAAMHGAYRIPTLLRRVDQLSRSAA